MILGIETATAVCAVALAENKKIVAARSVEGKHLHAEQLSVLIRDLLESAGVEPSKLDAVAVSIGPGSFTGLRIGLSVAKGLAFACSLPLVAVPTLEALALQGKRTAGSGVEYFIPMLDARRGEVYCASYHAEGDLLRELTPVSARKYADVTGILPEKEKYCLLGDAVELYLGSPGMKEVGGNGRMVELPRESRISTAETVALLGERRFLTGERADLAALEPFYLKEFFTTMTIQH